MEGLMQSYAIVDGSGLVINLVQWDGVAQWSPPAGCLAVQDDGTAVIGGTFAGGVFSPPAP
jgi:hypothetical protein